MAVTNSAGSAAALRPMTSCAAITAQDPDDALPPGSALVNDVIRPVLAETERTVSVALGRISIDDMVRRVAMAK
ncbi:MAG: hypothetical protein WB614_17120 [Pseudolabrys sp.]